jgi:hypothetical protein
MPINFLPVPVLSPMHGLPVPDARDQDIAEQRIKKWNECPGPRVGDYCIMPDGTYERFAYEWPEGLQTCINGSFYLGDGYASMSGGLNPTIPKCQIVLTKKVKNGYFWIFHHDQWQADNGINLMTECRVFKYDPSSGRSCDECEIGGGCNFQEEA